MAFMVSPGVSVAEIDLTTRVPIPSTSVGGYAGYFLWGPIEEVVTITDSNQLTQLFGKTDAYTYGSVMTCSNFLSYSNNLKVIRAANTNGGAFNSTTTGAQQLIKNQDDYDKNYSSGVDGISFIAKYAGYNGDSLKVSICMPDRANTRVQTDGSVILDANTSIELPGTFTATASSDEFTSTEVIYFDGNIAVNDVIELSGGIQGDDDAFVGIKGIVTAVLSNTVFRAVKYSDTDATVVENLLGTSSYPSNKIIRHARSAFETPSSSMFGTITGETGSTTITGTRTFFQKQLSVGDLITFVDASGTSDKRRVKSITTETSLEVTEPLIRSILAGTAFGREWEFRSLFENPPLTSKFGYNRTQNKNLNDEIHVVVVDEDGVFTGTKDNRGAGAKSSSSVLETYPNVSVCANATNDDLTTLYYRDVISQNSQYLRWGDHDGIGDRTDCFNLGVEFDDNELFDISMEWGTVLDGFSDILYEKNDQGVNTSVVLRRLPFNGAYSNAGKKGIATYSLSGGSDGFKDPVFGQDIRAFVDIVNAYTYFRKPEDVDVSLIMCGDHPDDVCTYVINDICEHRKDCVAFVSPQYSDIATKGNETTSIVNRRKSFPSSSYAVMDGNFKYAFDRFSGVYRWVPLNGDIAGLCAQSDNINPYISPAGFTRGNVKNVTKLAFNPNNAERDLLYSAGINPVISLPGGGTILFGDKTLLSRPSAFDRINVRRLFIILEKAIANAAQFSLFEFNDDFTRASFVSIVTPFLREVKSRRGITDYKVVCDTTNNPPNVIDRNEFRGDIFVKPTRSINFINLNFVAVGTGVQFNEVINAI